MRYLSTIGALVAIGLGASSLRAGTLTVPDQYGTIHAALAAANPGDTIVLKGGLYGTFHITKPVTIVGSPQARIQSLDGWGATTMSPAILLDGPGSGSVTLVNLRIDDTAVDGVIAQASPAIVGGGFTSLVIMDSKIDAPEWVNVVSDTEGAPAISVSVPYVTVSGSIVRGADNDTVTYASVGGPTGNAGIDAPSATVTVVDSTVIGGANWNIGLPGCDTTPCPCASLGGEGAPAIVAASVLHANSVMSGGAGSTVYSCWDTGNATSIGTQPNGPPTLAGSTNEFATLMFDSGPTTIGAPWTLTWSAPSPAVYLLMSTVITPPTQAGNHGLLYLSLATTASQAYPVPGSGQLTGTFPLDTNLVGIQMGLQIYDPIVGLSNPVLNTFHSP